MSTFVPTLFVHNMDFFFLFGITLIPQVNHFADAYIIPRLLFLLAD